MNFSPAQLERDILLALRDNQFPAVVTAKGHSDAVQTVGLQALMQKHLVTFKTTGKPVPLASDNFVIPGTVPAAQLTLDGERYVDRLRNIDTAQLERKSRLAILEVLATGKDDRLQTTVLPDIGPQRRAFLIRDLLENGLVNAETQPRQQGFFTVQDTVLRITPAGALAAAQSKTDPDTLNTAFKHVQRQLLLNGLDAAQPLATAHQSIKTTLPDWNAALFAAIVQPLHAAGVVQTEQRQRANGFFTESYPVLALTENRSIRTFVIHPDEPTRNGMFSGRQIAEIVLHHPAAALSIHIPTAGKPGAPAQGLTL